MKPLDTTGHTWCAVRQFSQWINYFTRYSFFFFKKDLFVYVYICVWGCAPACRLTVEARWGHWYLGAGILGSCELSGRRARFSERATRTGNQWALSPPLCSFFKEFGFFFCLQRDLELSIEYIINSTLLKYFILLKKKKEKKWCLNMARCWQLYFSTSVWWRWRCDNPAIPPVSSLPSSVTPKHWLWQKEMAVAEREAAVCVHVCQAWANHLVPGLS